MKIRWKMYAKVVLAMYIVTALLLFLLAFITSKAKSEEMIAQIGIILIYLIATMLGGFLIGRVKGQKRFLWGFLMGSIYYGIVLMISAVVLPFHQPDIIHLLSSMAICMAGGTIGGMIS